MGEQLEYDKDEWMMLKFSERDVIKRKINEIRAYAGVMVYDGVIDDKEIKLLIEWLSKNKHFADKWPINELWNILEEICKDGVIDDDERKRLLDFLKEFASLPDSKPVIQGIYDENVSIVFEGKHFLFTGKLAYGDRKKAKAHVTGKGGLVLSDVNKDIDYLVVGELGSEAYSFGSYGNKIDSAITMRKEGHPCKIIKELDFVKAVSGN